MFKAIGERRYTFAPLYAPDRIDAHGEYASADSIQQGVWDYVRRGDRRIRLEHATQNYAPVVGEWVEIVCWPQKVSVVLAIPGAPGVAASRKVTLPAGTAWMGVVWTPAAWPLVKSGKLGGLSLGGRTKRRNPSSTVPSQSMGWQDKPREVSKAAKRADDRAHELIHGVPFYARDPNAVAAAQDSD